MCTENYLEQPTLNGELVPCTRMYCLQWLIPVLLLPKPVNPAFLYNHAMFVILYLLGFVLERRPCAICSLVFAAAVFLICYSWSSHCVVWPCEPSEVSVPITDHWCSVADNIFMYIQRHRRQFADGKECLNVQQRYALMLLIYCWICLMYTSSVDTRVCLPVLLIFLFSCILTKLLQCCHTHMYY